MSFAEIFFPFKRGVLYFYETLPFSTRASRSISLKVVVVVVVLLLLLLFVVVTLCKK